MKAAADLVGGRRKLRDLLGASTADVAAWITHRTTIESLPDAFSTWESVGSGVIKAIVDL